MFRGPLFFLLLFPAVLTFAQDIDQSQNLFIDTVFLQNDHNTINSVRKMFLQLCNLNKIPGAQITVSKNGIVLLSEALGYADLNKRTPVLINSKFRAGSIAKSMTSLALGQLYEQGKLDIDASIYNYLPSFPVKKYPFTTRQLAGHIAGIRSYNYQNKEFNSNVHFHSVEESLSIFKDDSLLFEPGTKYEYTTYGYTLLSAIIERASGVDFLKFMEKEIFGALGMLNTVPEDNTILIADKVNSYTIRKNKIVNTEQVDNSNKWGGGGFLSTAYDIDRMGNGILQCRIITESTRELLFTSLKLKDSTFTGYGLGWSIGSDAGHRYVYHVGSPMGGKAFLIIFPEDQLVLAFTANLDSDLKIDSMLEFCRQFLPVHQITSSK